jgi:hypothetical protein
MKFIVGNRYSLWMMALVLVFGLSSHAAAQADAFSGMLSTEQLVQKVNLDEQRSAVAAFLSRGDVQAQLEARGVDFTSAQQRVGNLSALELASLSAQIDELPAGQGALETILFLLVIFMLLDIAGVTDIFPGL